MTKNEFKEIFANFFTERNLKLDEIVFNVHPIEEDKKYNSVDDVFRLTREGYLTELETKRFTFDQVVDLFTWFRDKYPMWVDIYIEKEDFVHLYFSRRFRKYSEVSMVKDRDVPPFKLIDQKRDLN